MYYLSTPFMILSIIGFGVICSAVILYRLVSDIKANRMKNAAAAEETAMAAGRPGIGEPSAQMAESAVAEQQDESQIG